METPKSFFLKIQMPLLSPVFQIFSLELHRSPIQKICCAYVQSVENVHVCFASTLG